MLDSKQFTFRPFADSRRAHTQGFEFGASGPLLIATNNRSGKKYLVKHTYSHNAVNEYAAGWLAGIIGALTPSIDFITPHKTFASKFAVAIEFIDGFSRISKDDLDDTMRKDLVKHYCLALFTARDDILQMSAVNGRVYSYDFSESFCNYDDNLIRMDNYIAPLIHDMAVNRLASFRRFLSISAFNAPGYVSEFGLNDSEFISDMRASTAKIASITDDDIFDLGDEIYQIYPKIIADYYVACAREMRRRAKELLKD